MAKPMLAVVLLLAVASTATAFTPDYDFYKRTCADTIIETDPFDPLNQEGRTNCVQLTVEADENDVCNIWGTSYCPAFVFEGRHWSSAFPGSKVVPDVTVRGIMEVEYKQYDNWNSQSYNCAGGIAQLGSLYGCSTGANTYYGNELYTSGSGTCLRFPVVQTIVGVDGTFATGPWIANKSFACS